MRLDHGVQCLGPPRADCSIIAGTRRLFFNRFSVLDFHTRTHLGRALLRR